MWGEAWGAAGSISLHLYMHVRVRVHLPPDGARVVALGRGEDGVAQGKGALVALEEGLERDVEGVAVGVIEALVKVRDRVRARARVRVRARARARSACCAP